MHNNKIFLKRYKQLCHTYSGKIYQVEIKTYEYNVYRLLICDENITSTSYFCDMKQGSIQQKHLFLSYIIITIYKS